MSNHFHHHLTKIGVHISGHTYIKELVRHREELRYTHVLPVNGK